METLQEEFQDKAMKKEEIVQLMVKTKIIPLFYEGDISVAKQLIDVCYEGGARIIEFTNRGERAAEVFKDMIPYCEEKYPEMVLGVGSISSVEQAENFLAMGAHFLVSPFLDKDIADYCNSRDILWTGGCATLTEMHTAHRWGIPIMKAFPCLLYTSPSPRDRQKSRMPSSA